MNTSKPLNVGDLLHLYVNQDDREATVLAILGAQALFEYTMPNGKTYLTIVELDGDGRVTSQYGKYDYRRKPVSYNALPKKWFDAVAHQLGDWYGGFNDESVSDRAMRDPWNKFLYQEAEGRRAKLRQAAIDLEDAGAGPTQDLAPAPGTRFAQVARYLDINYAIVARERRNQLREMMAEGSSMKIFSQVAIDIDTDHGEYGRDLLFYQLPEKTKRAQAIAYIPFIQNSHCQHPYDCCGGIYGSVDTSTLKRVGFKRDHLGNRVSVWAIEYHWHRNV